MDGTMVKEVERIVKESTQVFGDEGRIFSALPLHPVFHEPRPAALEISTLTGLVDYIESNVDDLNRDTLLILIEDEAKVSLRTNLWGEKNQRDTLITVRFDLLKPFPFGQWQDPETFNIALRSRFIETEELTKLVKYVSLIRIENEADLSDDGVTQKATIRRGASGALVGADLREAPSRLVLKPFRTFAEIDQPESEFLFRLNKDGSCNLIEADGGAWKNVARLRIKEYLQDKLKGLTIIA